MPVARSDEAARGPVQFTDPSGARRTLYPGLGGRDRTRFKDAVLDIAERCRRGVPLSADQEAWLARLGRPLRVKLAGWGIGALEREDGGRLRLRSFCARFLWERRRRLASSSKESDRQTVRELVRFVERTAGRDARLLHVTADLAAAFRSGLESRGLRRGTVNGYMRRCRTLFGPGSSGAVGRGLVVVSPFRTQEAGPVASERERFVTLEETARLLAACPSMEWRVYLMLLRFGAVRAEKEALGLTWADVDFERAWVHVRGSVGKGGRERSFPMCKELELVLAKAHAAAPDGSERVVQLSANNLTRGLQVILRRAGLKRWPKLRAALRQSRCTEWNREFGAQCEAAWAGHRPDVAHDHYLLRHPDTAKAAIGWAAGGNKALQKALQHGGKSTRTDRKPALTAREGDPVESAGSREDATACASATPDTEMGWAGLEPATPAFSMRCSTN